MKPFFPDGPFIPLTAIGESGIDDGKYKYLDSGNYEHDLCQTIFYKSQLGHILIPLRPAPQTQN